jgi:hypothetical protein
VRAGKPYTARQELFGRTAANEIPDPAAGPSTRERSAERRTKQFEDVFGGGVDSKAAKESKREIGVEKLNDIMGWEDDVG